MLCVIVLSLIPLLTLPVGLGTSTAKEAKEYFCDMARHRIPFKYSGPQDDEAITLVRHTHIHTLVSTVSYQPCKPLFITPGERDTDVNTNGIPSNSVAVTPRVHTRHKIY